MTVLHKIWSWECISLPMFNN